MTIAGGYAAPMTTPKIAGVATATPRYRFDQRTVLGMAGYVSHQFCSAGAAVFCV